MQQLETSVTQVQTPQVAAIVEQVHQQLSATSFNVWFKDSTQFVLRDGELRVGVPNLFVCDYMETRFSRLIADIARKELGTDVAVRFHIDAELFRRRRETELTQGQEFLAEQSSPKPTPPQTRPTASVPAPPAARSSEQEASPLLTLDKFVVGDCNRMAYAAATEVCRNPGQSFNPLFIHGSCGLGKTHLLQGIVNGIRLQNPERRVLYITAEQFTNRYIMAVKTRSLDAFRNRFRNLDVLAIDDIHFLANKQATQEEFLHTFNAFDLGHRQVVMASDCHTKMLKAVQDSLVNRFVSGMVAQMSAPDRRTRVEILRRKAAMVGAEIGDDVLEFVARHATGSVRELEGALIRIIAYASLDKQRVTLAVAQEALAEHIATTQAMISLDGILDTVSQFFAVSKGELTGEKRTRTITLPRQLAMFLSRRLTPLSFPEIGRLMGGKNHTTVIAACKRVEAMIESKEQVTWHDGAVQRQAKAGDLVQMLEDRLRR